MSRRDLYNFLKLCMALMLFLVGQIAYANDNLQPSADSKPVITQNQSIQSPSSAETHSWNYSWSYKSKKKSSQPTVFPYGSEIISLKHVYTIMLCAIVLVSAYYFRCWRKNQPTWRDSKTPRESPPENFSAVELGFLIKMRYSYCLLIAALINMALKGFLKIERNSPNSFTLSRQLNFQGELLDHEQEVAKSMFGGPTQGTNTENIMVGGSSGNRRSRKILVGSADSSLKQFLEKKFFPLYYTKDTQSLYIGMGISFCVLVSVLLPVWPFLPLKSLLFFTVIIFIISKWRKIESKQRNIAIVILLPAILISSLKIPQIPEEIQYIYAGFIIILIALNFAFYYYGFKIPTSIGTDLMLKANGFKTFLKANAEYKNENSPYRNEGDPRFEKYLTYAVALKIKGQWSGRSANNEIFSSEFVESFKDAMNWLYNLGKA